MAQLHERLQTAAADPTATGKTVVERVRDDDVPFMAASIAYQAFVSLVPILVLLFLLVAAVGDQALATRVVTATEGFLPDAAQALLEGAIAGPVGIGGASASVIGFVMLVWGSLKVFRGLDTAFSAIYGTEGANTLLDQLRDGAVVLAVLGLTVLAMVAAGSVFALLDGPLLRFLDLAVLVVGLTVAFLPIYRYFPDAALAWADALPGAVFAAVGWTALQFLFQFYVALSGRGDGTGAIGAILLLLLWLYLAGLVLLIGGVVNAVLLGEGDTGRAVGSGSRGRRALVDELHRERDRRLTLENEVARLERRLADPSPSDRELEQLRADRRRLRARLRWEQRPLPIRLSLRLLGREPPPTVA